MFLPTSTLNATDDVWNFCIFHAARNSHVHFKVTVNNRQLDLVRDIIKFDDVTDCENNSPCLRSPCRNGASCYDTTSSAYGFECRCVAGFTGQFCERAASACDVRNPCQNNALCQSDASAGIKCACPLGYQGRYCERGNTHIAGLVMLGLYSQLLSLNMQM